MSKMASKSAQTDKKTRKSVSSKSTTTGKKNNTRSASSKSGSKSSAKSTVKSSKKKTSSRSSSAARELPSVQGIKLKSRAVETAPPQRSASEPKWVRQVRKELPPYADELLAFLLIGVGLLSFLTLLSPESGELGSAWSSILTLLFGAGAFVISGVILAAGAALLVPKLGIPVHVNWWRLTLGEIVFVLVLAYIHANIRAGVGGEAGRVEAYASAMEGHGGGLVGWAVQDSVHMLFGDVVTGIVLLAFLAISLALMLGVNRRHLLENLDRLHAWLLEVAERWRPVTVPPVASPTVSPQPAPSVPFAGATPAPPASSAPAGSPASILKPAPSASPVSSADGKGAPVPAVVPAAGDASDSPAEGMEPDGPMIVELPPLPGRPSIVTGDRGAGAVTTMRRVPGGKDDEEETRFRRADQPMTRMDRLKSRMKDPTEEVKMRFKLEEIEDKRKVRKREDSLPPLKLLDDTSFDRPDNEEINISARVIEETVADFGMAVQVVGVKAGPTVTQYAVSPITKVEGKDGETVVQRVRVTRVARLATDLSLALAAPSVRIQAPVPGTNYIGIEVPNAQPGIVSLRPVIESEQFYKYSRSPLAIALGREVDGAPAAADLSKMPHLLIGGTTGSGKSVCLRSIATCLVSNNTPEQLRLVMLDPKMVELVRFNGLPHLLGHVEVELDRIIGVLRWITREMDRRYKLMEESMSRNIDVYNHGRRKKDRLPRMVVLIDELAELMMEFPDETEHLITRLAQMARATGIHLVVATQRPSTDVVTGLIKANFPARISFAVATGIDSRVIIDSVGAEDLIGKGDMLYQAPEAAGPVRLQSCFVGDNEMERVVDFWVDNWTWEDGEEDEEWAPWEKALRRRAIVEETDELLEEAVRLVQQEQEASASMIQRKLNVGYPRAGRIIDSLFRLGVVGPELAGGRTRDVLIKADDDPVDFIVKNSRGRRS